MEEYNEDNDEREDNDDDAGVDPLARADELRAESYARRKQRGGTATTPRSTSSVWTTLAFGCMDNNSKPACAICGVKIAVKRISSSNIVTHYHIWHKQTVKAISKAASLAEKRAVMERAVAEARSTLSLMTSIVTSFKKSRDPSTVFKDLKRRVSGVLVAASRQLPLDLLGCAELEEFVHCAGGTIDKSKEEYVKLLPAVYEAVARMSAEETCEVSVGSFTYVGWSAKLGAPISGARVPEQPRTGRERPRGGDCRRN